MTLFIVEADTEDDLFMLLAALHSGDHCFLLSNDYFRQHLYQIGRSLNYPPGSYMKIHQHWLTLGWPGLS